MHVLMQPASHEAVDLRLDPLLGDLAAGAAWVVRARAGGGTGGRGGKVIGDQGMRRDRVGRDEFGLLALDLQDHTRDEPGPVER